MASQAGYEVVGVANKRNHEMIRGLGVSMCFDQSDPDSVDSILTYLKGTEVVGAYNVVSNDFVLNALCEILDRSGGGRFIASMMPGAEEKASKGVEIKTNFAADMAGSGKAKAVWQWVNKAMEENRITYMSQLEVVGKGLEQVQHAVHPLWKGVSAGKLVVSI